MAANPNTMTFKTVFSAEYQLSHFKEPVYQILADTRLEPDLTKGQIIARSWASDVVANDMAPMELTPHKRLLIRKKP